MTNWYCIEAYDGAEHDVYLRLANAQLNVWRPIDVVRPANRRSNNKEATAVRPRRISRFGRYIFLNGIMTESLYHAVRNTTNVKRFVCFAGSDKPCIIPDDLILFYKKNPTSTEFKIKPFVIGEKVIIEGGPLKNIMAVVKSVSNKRVLELEFNLSGSAARIVIEAGNVRRTHVTP
jgi:transcription antitermination factor NusG